MAATAPDGNCRRSAGGYDETSMAKLFTTSGTALFHLGTLRWAGTALAVAALFSLAAIDTAGAAEGRPTPARSYRQATPAKASTARPMRRPGTAQRAQSTVLRWAPYRTKSGNSATSGQFAKYGRTANRETIARRQPSFDDNGNEGAATEPAIPSADQPATDIPGPFDLPAPEGADAPALPGPGGLPLPGLDTLPPSDSETSPFPSIGPSDNQSSQDSGLGPAPFGDTLAQGSRFELGPCPTIEDLDPIGVLTDRIEPDTSGAMPPECGLGDRDFAGRNWSLTTFTWKASAICHKPLYFEQMALERYGHSCHPLVEPFVSGAHFFATIPVLPYKMGMDPPWECQYPLGYYRPGNCAPHLKYPIPLSLRGALTQAGVVTGLVFILP